jgi:hypothetical protein
MKLLIVLAFFAVIVSLGSALIRLNRSGGSSDRGVVKALTWRIGLSIALFLFIMLAIWMGWTTPHGVGG